MGEWTRGDLFDLLTLPFTMIAAAAAVTNVPYPRLRRALLATVVMVFITDACGVILIALRTNTGPSIRRPDPNPTPKPKPSPAVTPSPAKPKPTPEQTRASDSTDPVATTAAPFVLSSDEGSHIRTTYCLDSEFEGQAYQTPDAVVVDLSKASFRLCTRSHDSDRMFLFQVGVGRRGDIEKLNRKAITWGTKLEGHISAGEPVDMTPGRVSIAKSRIPYLKKGAGDLSGYAVIIRVYNPDRRGEYFLSGGDLLSSH